MNVLQTEWWSAAVPPEWWAEAEGDSILIGDRDHVGCIEVTTLCKDEGVFEQQEVATIAREHSVGSSSWKTVASGEFSGVVSDFTEEGAAIREWYVAAGSVLLFITYSCDEENRGLDDAAVDDILDTFMPLHADSDHEA